MSYHEKKATTGELRGLESMFSVTARHGGLHLEAFAR